MAELPSQPFTLLQAVPVYPSHNYEGEGWIYTLRVGDSPEDFVGWLTVQGEKVGFYGTQPPWTDGGFWRTWVQDRLREGARINARVEATVAAILETVYHDRPAVFAPLAGLAERFG